LVFSGESTRLLLSTAVAHGVEERVIFLGEIAEKSLASIYRGASALIFPSLYEGFGLPVLEAMACGTPVVTSNTTALPEIAGKAALLVDPESTDNLAAAITAVVNNKELRQSLRTEGLRRATRFTWAATADRTLRALAEVEHFNAHSRRV